MPQSGIADKAYGPDGIIIISLWLQYACSAWDPHYQKDKAALESKQRKTARFITGNYDWTASVTGMRQDLKWDTLETIRRHARLSVVHKMYYGFLDGKWEDYLIPNRERRTRGSHDFKFIVLEGHKDIFRFSYFPRQWLNGTNFRKKLLPVNFSLFLKVQHSAIFNYQFILVFTHSFSFYCHLLFLSVLELAWCPSWMLPTKRYLDLDLHLEDILLLHIALIKEAVDGSRNKLRVKTCAI